MDFTIKTIQSVNLDCLIHTKTHFIIKTSSITLLMDKIKEYMKKEEYDQSLANITSHKKTVLLAEKIKRHVFSNGKSYSVPYDQICTVLFIKFMRGFSRSISIYGILDTFESYLDSSEVFYYKKIMREIKNGQEAKFYNKITM